MGTTLISEHTGTDGVVVLKFGGEVIASAALPIIASDVAKLAEEHGVIIVHGGGPQATKLQEQLGQKAVKVAGRRVTDEATLDVMKMVVAGKLNVDLCAALLRAGARPVGLNGASSLAITAVRRPPRVYPGAGDAPVDLGLVGDVTGLNIPLLGSLIDHGYTPVLACLGASAEGEVFNINADTVANRVAVSLKASSLVLISDVPGVLRDISDPSSRIPSLTVEQGTELIASGIVKEGMIPKLEESFAAIADGVRRIHIVGRITSGDLAREVASPGSVGTVLLP